MAARIRHYRPTQGFTRSLRTLVTHEVRLGNNTIERAFLACNGLLRGDCVVAETQELALCTLTWARFGDTPHRWTQKIAAAATFVPTTVRMVCDRVCV
jgi:hypothetical protein